MNIDKRLIEESFPVKEVSIESAYEKNIRHGQISTLHIWWARRPLASSRATTFAALIPPSKDDEEWQKQRNFISELSKWENSNNSAYIEKARSDILKANGGIPPKVIDPFGGGGSIPLEALRLGCETYSNDYNPVAVLIQKCTLEYPQRYGHRPKKNEKWGELSGSEDNPIVADVKKWGQWVLEEAKKEIEQFYPTDSDGSIPVGYIWTRTIPCQNPSCGAEIPLMRQFWLAKKAKKKVALFPYVEKGQVKFKIVGDGYEEIPKDFDPEKGTVTHAVSTCPLCRSTIDANTIRRLFQEKKSYQRMIAIVLQKPHTTGKKYRIASLEDNAIFQNAESYLVKKKQILLDEWGIEPVPNEEMPTTMPGGIHPPNYGITKFGDLFNSRQNLALITFSNIVHIAYHKMLAEGYDEEYAKAVTSYLGLAVDELSRFTSVLNTFKVDAEAIVHVFGRSAIPMLWDYCENNPLGDHGGTWQKRTEDMMKVMINLTPVSQKYVTITHTSATSLPYSDNFFDAVFTDPPYYYNVTYADLSDFFYVWLKRSIGPIFPELFSTPLTPKTFEIIEGSFWDMVRYKNKDKIWFEQMLTKTFKEFYRILKPNGISIIVYTHKSTEGWESLINSLLDSGLILTGAWPIHTEMKSRLMAQESAALASSIYIVARKMERQPTGFYNNVKEELKIHLNKKLERLWHEGISGADFFIAAIGSAIEVFGKYEQVMDYEGNVVRADRLLLDVRKIATDYAVRQILHNGFAGEISDMARLYVLWRWNYSEAKVPFDEGRKLGQSCGIDISHEWSHTGFIKKEKEFIRLLGPQERKLEDLEGSKDMIDVLHQVLLLWEKSKRDEMIKVLQQTGYGKSEAFYRVAQAISESLPNESKEKKLLEGFTAGRERMTEEVKKEARQARLDL